jgi:hypothetical protein|tara:strand:+ start:967 stop:1158 length:192 start_codon:yes stop_codon:yes gene_type:complete
MTHYEVAQILWDAMLQVLEHAEQHDDMPLEDVKALNLFLKECHRDLKESRKSLEVKLPEFKKP